MYLYICLNPIIFYYHGQIYTIEHIVHYGHHNIYKYTDLPYK